MIRYRGLLWTGAHSSKLNLSKKFDECQSELQVENFNETDEGKEEAKRGHKGFFSKERQPKRRDSMKEFRENNIEIFRKAFGDSHYFVKAGREGLVTKDDEYAKEVDGKIFGGGRAKKDCDFARVNRKGFFSNDDQKFQSQPEISRKAFEEAKRGRQGFISNEKFADQNNNVGIENNLKNRDGLCGSGDTHRSNSSELSSPSVGSKIGCFKPPDLCSTKYDPADAAGKSSSFVDLIGKKEEKFHEINGRKSFVPPLMNADDDVKFVKDDQNRDNPSIADANRSNSFDPEMSGAFCDKVSQQGFFNKNVHIRENVEIFRKAFGDGHYFVKACREGLFSKDDEFAKDDDQVSVGSGAH